MGSIKTTIQIDIKTSNLFEIKPKIKALSDLAQLDNEALSKLAELAKSAKAIEQLKNNFGMIKSFLN